MSCFIKKRNKRSYEEYFHNNGKIEGVYRSFYCDYHEIQSIYEESEYINGIKNGFCKIYYPVGLLISFDDIEQFFMCSSPVLKSEHYEINGLKNGLYKEYYPNGNILKICDYNNGNLLKSIEFYLNGTIKLSS